MKKTNLKKNKGKRSRKIAIVFLSVFMLAGFVVAIFPVVNGLYHTWYANQEIEEFIAMTAAEEPTPTVIPTAKVEITASEEPEEVVEEPPKPTYTELRAAMEAYNLRIFEEKQEGLCDAWSYTNPSFVLEDYGVPDGAMGVLSIPSLSIKLPLYLGATYDHLSNGAAQLSQTSLPIGGENTNCVIAGHCGWRGSNYFRYLSQIQIGSYVYVTNLWETLTYEVVETAIIWPYDTDKILIQEGKDMITLFTCHPYASGGRFRFVVYCERVYEDPALAEEEKAAEDAVEPTTEPEEADKIESIVSEPIDYTGGEAELYTQEVVIVTGSGTGFAEQGGVYLLIGAGIIVLFAVGIVVLSQTKKGKTHVKED